MPQITEKILAALLTANMLTGQLLLTI